jgi:hypothetical protein
MNNETMVDNGSRKGLDRCNCSQCKGAAGTTRVCFNARKLAARTRENVLARNVGLSVLSCFFLQGHAAACGTNSAMGQTPHAQHDLMATSYAEAARPTVGPDYYQSSDNPFHAE